MSMVEIFEPQELHFRSILALHPAHQVLDVLACSKGSSGPNGMGVDFTSPEPDVLKRIVLRRWNLEPFTAGGPNV